jgi:outer membrane biosynthesis protein TonB
VIVYTGPHEAVCIVGLGEVRAGVPFSASEAVMQGLLVREDFVATGEPWLPPVPRTHPDPGDDEQELPFEPAAPEPEEDEGTSPDEPAAPEAVPEAPTEEPAPAAPEEAPAEEPAAEPTDQPQA